MSNKKQEPTTLILSEPFKENFPPRLIPNILISRNSLSRSLPPSSAATYIPDAPDRFVTSDGSVGVPAYDVPDEDGDRRKEVSEIKGSGLHSRVFLDHAAGPLNPNAFHLEGREAAKVINQAKKTIADYLNATPSQISFAPSASLANYFILSSFPKVAASAIEHSSIINHPNVAETLPVDPLGRVIFSAGIKSDIISISLANHEVGTIQDLPAIKAAYPSIPLHSDLSAAFTKIPINIRNLNLNFATLSGAKLGFPGVAIIYAKSPKTLPKFPFGTPNIPAIAALTDYLLKNPDLPTLYESKVRPLRDYLKSGITRMIKNTIINGDEKNMLPNILNISFDRAEGESILLALDEQGIAVATGSACTTGTPSHVLRAMNPDPTLSHNSIRFSLGLETTKSDISHVLKVLPPIIKKLRELSTL